MKYLYCPKCKELRVKPWYSMRDRCARCLGDVRVIPIPSGVLTYVMYGLAAVAMVFAYLYMQEDDDLYIFVAVVFAVAMGIAQFKELTRGEKYARAKIRLTHSDRVAQDKKSRR